MNRKMRKTFGLLDDVLIERLFQPVADFLAHRLGLGRMSAARICLDIAAIGWILSQARALSDVVLAWDVGVSFLRLLLLLIGLVVLINLRAVFARIAGAGNTNPLRVAMLPHRAIVLVMVAARLGGLHRPGLAEWADLTMLGCAAVALYLGACASRPPLRRRADAVEQGG